MEQLRYCPFCGGGAEIHEVHYEYPKLNLYWARCETCSAEIKHPCITKSEAASKWNNRVTDLTLTPKCEPIGNGMKNFLKDLSAEEFITFIHDICEDWDGYRFADGLGTLLNEIQSYTAYFLSREKADD